MKPELIKQVNDELMEAQDKLRNELQAVFVLFDLNNPNLNVSITANSRSMYKASGERELTGYDINVQVTI